MKIYSIVNLVVQKEKILINLDKFHTKEDGSFRFEPKNIDTSLPILSFQKEDATKFPLFNDLNIKINKSDSIDFKAAYISETISSLIPEYTKENTYRLTSLTYELPLNPSLALQIIAVFDNYLTQTKEARFSKKSIKQSIDEHGNLKICLMEFFDDSHYIAMWDEEMGINPLEIRKRKFSDKHPFLQGFINASNIPEIYLPVIDNLKKYYAFCEIEHLTISECLNNTKLNQLISTNKNPYLLLTDLSPSQQLSIVNEIKRDLLKGNSSIPWEKIINRIFEYKIDNLFRPSIGQKAHDGGKYNLNYTEIEFLKHIANNLTLKGNKICISNLNENPAYLKYYAFGCKNNNIFEKELRFLGKYVGLEFEDCDFHKEIVLTQKCSDYLKEKGFT
ncbi:TPA: Dot/Icm T4SS effector PieB/LirD, partial [Legionella pneumophila]|nr:Dot/Icm T4SS effector PieB/LirD [Legionella pneumophila]